MKLYFSSLVFLSNTLILWLFVYRIKRVINKEEFRIKYTKTKITSDTLLSKYFLRTIFILFLGYLIFSLGLIFFSENKIILRIFKIIGDIFLFSSYVYGVNIPLFLRFPKIKRKIVSSVLLFFVFLLVIFQIFNYPSPEVVKGLVYWNLHPFVAWSLYTFALIMWFPTGIIFLAESFKNKEEFFRFLFFGLSFIIISSFGPLMVVTRNENLVFLSHIFMTFGYIFLFLGIIYKDFFISKKV